MPNSQTLKIALRYSPQNLRLPAFIAAVTLAGLSFGAVAAADDADWSDREFWQTVSGKPVSEGWEFLNGEVSLVAPGKGGTIISREALPPHFELSWKWKIEKGVNSGLKYRVRRFGRGIFNNSYLGVEYQIIDSAPKSTAKGATAAIYDLVGPKSEKTLHPPGNWNESKVVAVGHRIEHYLNGELVSSADTTGPNWDTTIAFSKFGGSSNFGRPMEGDRVMLTDHGGKVSYKDFHFVAREAPAPPRISVEGPFLGNASRNSWADQNSIVVWTRTTRHQEMNVDGARFISINKQKANRMAKQTDAEKLLRSQLPPGKTLDDMFGACPGSAGRVRLSYFPGRQKNSVRHTEWKTTAAESDFTAQWKLEGLKPNTKYTTVIEAQTPDGEPSDVRRGSFQTAPKKNAKEEITFCITTCHDFIRRDDGLSGHKIYPAMKKMSPNFVVHAGDIEYYDKPDPWAFTRELMRFKWGRIFSLPNNRDFYNSTTSYFIKDDHDTLSDDSWPGRTYGAVTFNEGVQLFNEEQFPARDPRYANIRWGRDLEIWILEGRDFRSPNTMKDGPDKTILGQQQKAWLLKTLEESDAEFKLILSPTPIVGPDRANKKDNHANDVFAYEGNELRQKISRIPGAIVFCGDRHWQYASVDAETNLWEFGCGPGSEKHQLGWQPGDERPDHRFLRVAGGFLSGALSYPDDEATPRLTIRHHSVTGEQVSEFEFPQRNVTTSENSEPVENSATEESPRTLKGDESSE